jgi:hypothetical protein
MTKIADTRQNFKARKVASCLASHTPGGPLFAFANLGDGRINQKLSFKL